MFDLTTLGKWLMLGGAGVFGVGLLLWGLGRVGVPLGNLPGDFKIQNENFSFYFPFASSILVSVVLSLVLNLALRWFNRP